MPDLSAVLVEPLVWAPRDVRKHKILLGTLCVSVSVTIGLLLSWLPCEGGAGVSLVLVKGPTITMPSTFLTRRAVHRSFQALPFDHYHPVASSGCVRFQIDGFFGKPTSSTNLHATAGDAGRNAPEIDSLYPGTATERVLNIHGRVKSLSVEDLSGDWEEVRRRILWAGGLKDLPNNVPGQGYTGHSFNDDNHCDLCAMLGDVAHNLHGGEIRGIARGNRLGPGIEVASLAELGPGGSWSTCTNGCHLDPPQDVAHVQFRARIAFKLVWCPPEFNSFVLVDDAGELLNYGTPTGSVPNIRCRRDNYDLTKGGKYAREAERFHSEEQAS